MSTTSAAPELRFQAHIADFLAMVHGYRVLQQAEITDLEHFLAEDELWAFLQATQADTLQKLAEQYGSDTRREVFTALRQQLGYMPLWLILREGLKVKSLELRLFYPKPRSSDSAAAGKYELNRLSFRPHCYFGLTNKEIDLVLFLNGLPIVVLEVKHDKNQNVHHAVEQFAARDHSLKIFQHPFLYLAADTTEVMAATDPSRVEHFRWHNSGLHNQPQTEGEYPVEYLYREVLSKDQLLEALSFFLVRVPAQAADGDKPARGAYSIFPRYHQSRMVRRLADDLVQHFVANGHIGRKYLINHSAGSGKTLSMCWLADRLHSLYKPDSNQKLVDTVFILTDRKALDKNVRDDIEKFSHLKNIIGLARKADDLPLFLKQRKPIIVATQQKFAWILEKLQSKPELKDLRVAFLIDEAHRSQEGAMGAAIRLPFRKPDEADSDDSETLDEEDSYAKIIREYDRNQLFVAFTATPAPVTVQLFGEAFDSYTEDEAIKEGYIVDVVDKIISYKTLYNLHCKLVPDAEEEEKFYPKGVIAKALQNVAYQDEGLIQYKAEVMLRTFDEDIKPLIGGRAKAMIVTSSRLAGLRYYQIIKEKLKERGADYQVLYAFSDFVHPQTNEAISEHALNGLTDAELIEDRFEGDAYRLLVVASKFQTGFDQPLLAGMFLDKVVEDRNAVQTVSRLNRCYPGKDNVVVVDFTNNATAILKAFAKYRKGTPYQAKEPDPESCIQIYEQVLEQEVFSQADAEQFWVLLQQSSDPEKQAAVGELRIQFQTVLTEMEVRKSYVYLLSKLVSSFHFMSCFYSYPEAIVRFVQFAAYVGPQLIKQGSVSELMKRMQQTEVIKAGVNKVGEFKGSDYGVTKKSGGSGGGFGAPVKVSIQQVIDEIKQKFEISDEEALYIKQVTEEKAADQQIRMTVASHKLDTMFLHDAYREQVNTDIRFSYNTLARFEELADPKYTDTGGIFDIMAMTVIDSHLAAVM